MTKKGHLETLTQSIHKVPEDIGELQLCSQAVNLPDFHCAQSLLLDC